MIDIQNQSVPRKGVWLTIEQASKAKRYDLIVSDNDGWRTRVVNCWWRRDGRHGPSQWWSSGACYDDGGPAIFIGGFTITHCMEIPEFPA